MKNTIALLEQEEYYQGFRALINHFEPDQRESCLDLFKALSQLPKKQLKDFIERYGQEDPAENTETQRTKEEKVYSVLEKIALVNGIEVRQCDLEEELGPGYTCRYHGRRNGESGEAIGGVISLDIGLSGWKLNREFALALAYPQIMVDETYGNMITRKDKVKKKSFDKQAHNIATLLIDGIVLGLIS